MDLREIMANTSAPQPKPIGNGNTRKLGQDMSELLELAGVIRDLEGGFRSGSRWMRVSGEAVGGGSGDTRRTGARPRGPVAAAAPGPTSTRHTAGTADGLDEVLKRAGQPAPDQARASLDDYLAAISHALGITGNRQDTRHQPGHRNGRQECRHSPARRVV